MKNKCTTSLEYSQHLIAGLLPKDTGIEFFGNPETLEVSWSTNGTHYTFKELPKKAYIKLANAFSSNMEAKKEIGNIRNIDGSSLSFMKKVELYTYFMYGGCDSISYRASTINLRGWPLKPRAVKMLALIIQDHQHQVITFENDIPQHFYAAAV